MATPQSLHSKSIGSPASRHSEEQHGGMRLAELSVQDHVGRIFDAL
jgi:hypothetical protein